MKVLLIAVDSKYIHTNLALRYLRESIKLTGIDAQIKEFTINQQEEYVLSEICDAGADLLCFSSYIWNIEFILNICRVLKSANVNVSILLGGPEVSYGTEKLMMDEDCIDYVIMGEGEVTLPEVLSALSDGRSLKGIDGLGYRDKTGIVINTPRLPIENLDSLPSPYSIKEDLTDKIAYYETSRGCPFRCSFCMSSIDKSMRYFSVDRVKQDLSILLNSKVRQIKFVDRTFNADYRRAMEIMEWIIWHNSNNVGIHLEITADIINEEFLDFLDNVPVNMFQFEIGVQSLNEDTLRRINRLTNIERLFNAVKRIREKGRVHVHLDLIAGLPGESYVSFKDSLNGIHSLEAEKIQLGFLKMLKGTAIFNDATKYGIKYRSKAPYEVIRTANISLQEILQLKSIEELIDKYYNEKFFEMTLKYIFSNIYTKSFFDFYEDFSRYWKLKGLYGMYHSRKMLYRILHDYLADKNVFTVELKQAMTYDYVFNNSREELPDYLAPDNERSLHDVKKQLTIRDDFREAYFDGASNVGLLNRFRLVTIGVNDVLFVYGDTKNIFKKCKVYVINNWTKEYKDE